MALGADTGRILRLVMSRGACLTVLGLAIGIAGAAALTRVLRGVLYGVAATDLRDVRRSGGSAGGGGPGGVPGAGAPGGVRRSVGCPAERVAPPRFTPAGVHSRYETRDALAATGGAGVGAGFRSGDSRRPHRRWHGQSGLRRGCRASGKGRSPPWADWPDGPRRAPSTPPASPWRPDSSTSTTTPTSRIVEDGNAQSMIRQGVTSMIFGEGGSAAPSKRWKDFDAYFAQLMRAGDFDEYRQLRGIERDLDFGARPEGRDLRRPKNSTGCAGWCERPWSRARWAWRVP